MAFLVAQSSTPTLQAGPFLSVSDGITLLTALTIMPSDRQLSMNGGPLLASTADDTAVYLSEGHYAFTLSALDTETLGTLRIVIMKAGALVVWLDVVIVPSLVFLMMGGVPAAPMLLQDTDSLVTIGPFIASADGITVQEALTIPPTEVQLSKNDGTFVTSTNSAPLLVRGAGHYSTTLTADDTHALGDLRVSITLPDSLPVWLDVNIVSQSTWDLYFTPPGGAAIIIPPGATTPPAGSTGPTLPTSPHVASSLYPGISALLDDPQQLRADEATLLRFMSQAQQWVALRFRLLIHTLPFAVIVGVPWYPLPSTQPRLVIVTEVMDEQETMLVPVPVSRLRYSDPQWLASSGAPTRFYRVGWTHVGLYKVPDVSATFTMTGVCMPTRLREGAQPLETPASYDDSVMQVAAGLLLIGRERKYQKGLALVAQGLRLPLAQPQPEPAGVVG